MTSILITRPQAAAEFMADALAERGYEGVIEPMLHIHSTDVPQPEGDELHNIQALMITSANALTALVKGDYDASALFGIPCFCVGPRTAAMAEALGFRRIHHSNNDGNALADLLRQSLADKQKAILHIAGQDTDSKARDALHNSGFKLINWPIYKAEPAKQLSAYTIRLLQEAKVDGITFFSMRTAQTFISLLQQHKLETCCNRLIAVVLSPAIGDAVKHLPWRKLDIASSPTEESVLQCLTEILPVA